MKKQIEKLQKELNNTEFGTAKFDELSDRLHSLRLRDIEENPVEIGAGWCTSDGQWWV